MDGAPLTQEGVCQVFQIIEYLKRGNNIKCEGLFRKHGNLKKQQILKERLNKGIPVDLDAEEFTIHECASTLKNFLSDLPEPLLTDAYYRAHCQVAALNEEDSSTKKIQCLQLLFLLIPESNYILLRDLIQLLSLVVEHVESNKMNALNLATVFATHIICPRKMAPDCLQSNHQLYIKAIAFMIENSKVLFDVPTQLSKDAEMFFEKHPEKELAAHAKPLYGPKNSPVVNTVYSFVDRERTKAAASVSTTETALAELYAQVQAMPESAQKKRLINKLNDANGCGTPLVSGRKHVKTDASVKLKNLLTPKSKGNNSRNPKKEGRYHGSYSLRNNSISPPKDLLPATPLSSFKRNDSGPQKIQNNDASPELRERACLKPPKPQPPPRVSSLKRTSPDANDEMPVIPLSENCSPNTEILQTPRCRKPIMISEEKDLNSKSPSPSFLEEEAEDIIKGQMKPSDSMIHFLNGGTSENLNISKENSIVPDSIGQNKSLGDLNVLSPSLPKSRKRSITELNPELNPLAKSAPSRNSSKRPGKILIETDL